MARTRYEQQALEREELIQTYTKAISTHNRELWIAVRIAAQADPELDKQTKIMDVQYMESCRRIEEIDQRCRIRGN